MSVQQQAILIIYPCKFLGNLLLALPHFRAILADQKQVLLVLDERFRELADIFLPGEQRILYYPRSALASGQSPGGRVAALLGQLRRFQADVLLELEGESTSTTLSLLARAKVKRGPFFTRRKWIFDELVEFPHLTEHRWLGMQALCGPCHGQSLQPGYCAPCFSGASLDAVRRRLKDLGVLPGDRTAILHVGAAQEYKLWDPKRFAGVIAGLQQRGWQVVLIGAGEDDRRQAKRVLQYRLPAAVVDTIDQLSFGELAGLMVLGGCFIGNDSGPMHLAAACGLPTLALFGPTVDRIWAPLGDNARVVRGIIACHPDCRTITCVQDYLCLKSLGVDAVLKALEEQTAGNGR